jgi:hypothetical protein
LHYFDFGTALRNRTKGHGAITCVQCNKICENLAESNSLVLKNLTLFKNDFAFLYRSLSGKYRVTPMLGNCSDFFYLRKTKEERLPNGTYYFLSKPLKNEFIFSDPEINDIYLPNGNYKTNSFEVISYVTNEIKRIESTNWLTPTGKLPGSTTEGAEILDPNGNSFTNLPPLSSGIIERKSLEEHLRNELLKLDQHPIITLTGPGGVGKTTITIKVIDKLCNTPEMPYEVILWLSSRDIDLLESGPKVVKPRVISKEEISLAAYDLLEPSNYDRKDSISFFENCLTKGAAGKTLFIFDNFETISDPSDVYAWIDTYLRLPNKVLITTRIRDFVGDIPIEISGMDEDEALQLIAQESSKLGITDILSKQYINSLISESEGHPYVIKVFLGQIAQEQQPINLQRIFANTEHILTALFERTYEKLRPASKRIFLLLCSWRVFLPVIAIEAVSLRPGNERFDVTSAIEELIRFSLVEEIKSQTEGSRFVGVPLAASLFGRAKLKVSPFKVAVEEDRKVLMGFGAGKKEDISHGVMPRIHNLASAAALKASEDPNALNEFLPILEYISTAEPKAYTYLAQLILEVEENEENIKKAILYYRRYVEHASYNEKVDIWRKIAELSHKINDAVSEIHALSEAALLPTNTLETISNLANQINFKIKELRAQKIEQSWSFEVNKLIEKVAYKMASFEKDLDATNCSRLSWLFANIGQTQKAKEFADMGLEKDNENEYCIKLARKFDY